MIDILKQGLLTTVQDLGRTGYAHIGVTRSGALDRPALIRANRLIGNPDDAAGLETTLTGVTIRAQHATLIAVTGAPAQVTVDGRVVPFDSAVPVSAGETIAIGRPNAGVRSYVALAGGVRVAPVLGSRSTDTLSGLGPPPLRAGFVLPVERYRGSDAASAPTAADVDLPAPSPIPDSSQPTRVRVHLGPRHDWFTAAAIDTLLGSTYTVTVKSNRVAARLAGPQLRRAITAELPSEGIVLGSVQVPADGAPLVFLSDHPTTGGYPVIAVVVAADLPVLAQARPGTRIAFNLTSSPVPADPSHPGARPWTSTPTSAKDSGSGVSATTRPSSP